LSGAATALNSPINVAVDTVNNEMVVANATGTVGLSITVYPRTADGDVAFLRNIHGAATGLDNPVGVAVDTVHGTIVESNFTPSVSTFARLADNNASPLRSIAGGATGLSQTAGGVAVDTANDEIFVVNTNNNSITVYPRLADGNALPQRTVAGLLTGLAQPSFVAITTPLLPPVLQNAVSRKVHGGVGTFDLTLSAVTTNPTTEPRQGPAQTIVFTFDKPINAAIVTITEGVATALAPIFSGNSVIVGLAGVTDRQYVTVSLPNVASTDGATGGLGSVRLGFLVGDVSQNRVVTLADLGLVNAQLTLPVSAANFLKDVNANGTLTLADKGITNANLTRALPPP
jgi:hypothetical protein